MSDLKFADTHNLVAFLEKPTKSAGFEEIVDFLNANPIKYALTVNPTVYCSCIKQFWDTVKAKTVNGEVQLQALVDKKKVIITESTIRRDLQLEDVEDLWHIILNGDFPPLEKNEVTQILEVVPFEEQSDDLKKKLSKNNEAKMVLYNALPKKEYERIFTCKTAKDIWQLLLITHQGNSQVNDNKIDLLVQQYEQFTILEEESINSGFARFNTIITILKALDEGFSSKNYVRKFLRALHPKWRAKVMAIEELKDLLSLALDERIKSIALKAKKESSDDETSTFGNDDEEYAIAVRNVKKFFRRKGKFVRKPREERKSFRQRDEKKGKSDWKCF
ncbi:hypothetical protein Tco_0004552 [Tanacetum coccineum]